MIAWLTPEAATGDFVCRRLSIPLVLLPAVTGALAQLTLAHNWEEFGAMTPDEAADLALSMMMNYQQSEGACMNTGIGRIEYFSRYPTAEVDAGLLLLCDGSWYAKADYPEYWQFLQDASDGWRDDIYITAFKVPQLMDAFIQGNTVDIGGGGGNSQIFLSVANLPPHTHTDTQSVASGLAVAPGELPVALPSIAAVTGSTGSGTAIPSMPPYVRQWCFVRVR